MNFASLGLSEPILEGVRAAGYQDPTEIQARAIPLIRQGRDLIALGQTGSGKTAAYGLPLLELALQRARTGGPALRALVLVPTRELCVQVAESLRLYASVTNLKVCTAFGGVPLGIQESAFKRGLDVLVACPGRLLDHVERGNITLQHLELAVLDEADRMLDMGFLPQIRRIFMRCPRTRQNLLLSATLPAEIEALCKDFLPDAQRVQIGKRSQSPNTISHRFEFVSGAQKLRALERVLAQESGRVLIFVRTKLRAAQLGRQLHAHRLPADSIHGDKEAAARYSILQAFDRGTVRFLVATDVAARGIDVDGIELVINYEMPRAVEDYVHRTGRTGRAGARGRALSLVAPDEGRVHQAIVKHLQTTGGVQPEASRPRSAHR